MDELVIRARQGDHSAFETLASGAVDRLYAIAIRVLRDPSSAEDAVQDALVRAWRDLRALRDPGRFDAWLYRLLLNACRDEQRRSARRPIQVQLTGIERSDGRDQEASIAERDRIQRGFGQLTVEHRMALTLHHYLGFRPREIAEVLGIPEGTATSRIHYGTRALRAALATEAVVGSTGAETIS